MSISTLSYLDLASLAEAAYAKFGSAGNAKEELIAEGFSDTQAEDILSRWALVNGGFYNAPDDGYSSSLFKSVDGQGYVLAFRGTAGLEDLWREDIADIVADGLALDQILGLYNEWQRITSTGTYQVAKYSILITESAGLAAAIVGGPLTYIPYLTYLSQRSNVIVDINTVTVKEVVFENSTTVGLGLKNEIAANGLTLTGHSLGGHLASAFSRLFSSVGADALTVNGAGFGVVGFSGFAQMNVKHLFNTLTQSDSTFNPTKIINLHGDANPEFISQDAALQQPGSSIPIFIENPEIKNDTLGHGIKDHVDTLAVYDLFFKLDKTTKLSDLLSIFSGASNDSPSTLETIVDTLGKIFNTGVEEIQSSDIDDREKLHSAIEAIRNNTTFTSLEGKLKVSTVQNNLTTTAKGDYGQFLALYYLTPFVFSGAEWELKDVNPELYDLWLDDADLSDQDIKDGKANFSDIWYQDRAAMLAALVARNTNDTQNDAWTNNSAQFHFYRDEAGNIDLESTPRSQGVHSWEYIKFGDNAPNTINGATDNDRLYGDRIKGTEADVSPQILSEIMVFNYSNDRLDRPFYFV